LSASSLYLNGVAVGASVAVDDPASPATDAASSAIAKAAAINKVANLSGVYAKADGNTMSGSAMTAAATVTGTVSINGVVTDSFVTTGDNATSRKNTVAAINAKSAQTGVVAIDSGDDYLGVKLTAADGRNIVVASITGTTSAATGLVAGTSVGSIDLYTLDGRDISISAKTGADQTIANMGFRSGTYKSDVAQTTTYLRTAQAAVAPSSTTTGLLMSNSMIINGVAIGAALTTDDTASDTGATSSTRSSSAIAIAAAINRSSAQSGVTASAAPNVVRANNATAFAAGTTAKVFLNGVSFDVNTISRNGVLDSFNANSTNTGVVASAWGDGIQLTAVDGRNISIASSAGAASLGLAGVTIGSDGTAADGAATYISQVTLTSANKFVVQAGSQGVDNLQKLGFREGTFGGSDNGLKINQVDVSSSAGASQAITAIDAALNTVSAAQAKSGALNNRLDTIINNLAESSQNMSASRSRIMDTDYATETTNLAKQQIISQAATAMLAQANQQSQSVLSLLK
jgi:flagellin